MANMRRKGKQLCEMTDYITKRGGICWDRDHVSQKLNWAFCVSCAAKRQTLMDLRTA